MLLQYSTIYKYKIIDTATVINFFNKESGINLTPIFNQYLKQITTPNLIIRKNKNKLEYKWFSTEPNFTMPIDIIIKNKTIRLFPTTNWKLSKIKINAVEEIMVKTNSFYVDVIKE